MNDSAVGRLFKGICAGQEKKSQHQKVHDELKALHILQPEPIAVQARQKTIAINAMNSMPKGAVARLTGRSPAIKHTIRISVPCNIATVAPPSVPANHDA